MYKIYENIEHSDLWIGANNKKEKQDWILFIFSQKKLKFVRIKYMKLHTLEFLISMKMLNGQILNLDPKKCKLNEKYERKYALF